jgi:cell division protein FtsB
MGALDNLFYRKGDKGFHGASLARKIGRNKKRVAIILVGVIILGFVIFGNRGFVQRFRLQGEKARLEQSIREAETRTDSLQKESKALDGDKRAIEKVAREKHKMERDGDRVYRVSPGE